jgi:bifunctional DNA-binding transcriptional regulator/antitoxin component of YhaV-PrlF toxin-antitoxin module
MSNETMKVTRQIDDLGRIVLPAIVKSFGWALGTPLDIAVMEDETVILRAHKPCCTLCGGITDDLIAVANGFICGACRTSLKSSMKAEG